MKRRSFIQGVLALLGATVAAKAVPAKPRMLTDEFPNGMMIVDGKTINGFEFHVNNEGGSYRGMSRDGLVAYSSPTNQFNYPRVGYTLTDKGWEQHIT